MEPLIKIHRRAFVRSAGALAAGVALSRPAGAQTYPARTVRLIVGLPPGSAPDIVARLVAHWMAQRLGQPFVVDNRPGAGTNIATEAVVRATPDGYTLLLVTAGNAINTSFYRHLDFNFTSDIAPVAPVGRTPFVMVVNPSVPAKTLPEFIAYAKANPGKINLASPGVGGANHIFGELFQLLSGVRLVHVPYRGSLFPDLLAGQVQVYFGAIPPLLAHIRTGQLRALAVTTTSRVAVLPEVPAMDEFLPGYEASGWLGIGAPKNTPPAIVDRLAKQIVAFQTEPDTRTRLLSSGVEPLRMTPAAFGKFIAAETEKWAKVVKFAGIKAD